LDISSKEIPLLRDFEDDEDDQAFIDDYEILKTIDENKFVLESENQVEQTMKAMEKQFLNEYCYWKNEELDLLYLSVAKYGRHSLAELSNSIQTKTMVEIECYLKALERLKQFVFEEANEIEDSAFENERHPIIDKEALETDEHLLRMERKMAAEELEDENVEISAEMRKNRLKRTRLDEGQQLVERAYDEHQILHRRYTELYLEQKGCQLHPTTFDLVTNCLEIFVRTLIERADIYRMERLRNSSSSRTDSDAKAFEKQKQQEMEGDDVLMALHDLDRHSPFHKNNIHQRPF
jgi:hypothetical protein